MVVVSVLCAPSYYSVFPFEHLFNGNNNLDFDIHKTCTDRSRTVVTLSSSRSKPLCIVFMSPWILYVYSFVRSFFPIKCIVQLFQLDIFFYVYRVELSRVTKCTVAVRLYRQNNRFSFVCACLFKSLTYFAVNFNIKKKNCEQYKMFIV